MGSGASTPKEGDGNAKKTKFLGKDLTEQQLVMVDGFRVPVSLVRCRDELYQHGLGRPDLFQQSCSAPEVCWWLELFLDQTLAFVVVCQVGECVARACSTWVMHAIVRCYKPLNAPRRLSSGQRVLRIHRAGGKGGWAQQSVHSCRGIQETTEERAETPSARRAALGGGARANTAGVRLVCACVRVCMCVCVCVSLVC